MRLDTTICWTIFKQKMDVAISFPDGLTCDLTNYMYYKGGSEELIISWLKFLNAQFPHCLLLESVNVLLNKDREVEIYDKENVRKRFRTLFDNSPCAKICFHLSMCDGHQQCHSNAVMIDKSRKEFVIYEPHGETSSRMVNRLYPQHRKKVSDFVTEIIGVRYDPKKVHRDDEEGIQYRTEYHIQDTYKNNDIIRNRYLDEVEGYCTIWSLMFIHYNLLNPSISASELYRKIIDSHDMDTWALKVRAYSASVYNNYMNEGSQKVTDILSENNADLLSKIIKEQEKSYYGVCSLRLRQNFRQTLKIRQIENFVMEEPSYTILGNMINEERARHGKYYQRLCKSDSVKSGRLELIGFALNHFHNSLNVVVFLQLADRFNSVSAAKDDDLYGIASIVDHLYNIRMEKKTVSDRTLLKIAQVLEFSFFEPNVYFFYSLCIELFPDLGRLFHSETMDYFYHAHLICMTNHIYACLPSSFQFVGLLWFLTKGSFADVIRNPIPERLQVPLETLLSKTTDEIRQCGRLVNQIIMSTKGLSLHPSVDEYQHNLPSMVFEDNNEITIPVVRGRNDHIDGNIPTKVNENVCAEYKLVKTREGFQLFAHNDKFHKVYSSTVDSQLRLFYMFRELSFVNTELLGAHFTDETLTPILEILPYGMTLRDIRQTMQYEKNYLIMNSKKMTIEQTARSSGPSLVSFVKRKMKSCFEQLSDMHNKGFIHGNIKLDYVVIRHGKCHLSDFRYVRRLTNTIYNYGYTVPYADDRIQNGKGTMDFASDVFALAMAICGLFYLHFEKVWSFLDENLVAYRGFERFDNIPKIAQYLAISLEKYNPSLSDLVSKMFASRKYRFTMEECLRHKFFLTDE